MESKDIFSLALGLETPWYVEKVELLAATESLKELHLHLNFQKGYEFTTAEGLKGKGYDTEQRTWQHLDFFQHRCYLHARVPRIQAGDGSVSTVSVPWAREGSGFTLLFEAYAMLLIECEMPVCKVAKCVKVTAPRIWRMFNYWIEKAKEKMDLSSTCEIGIDETSSRKGHNYITLFVDMERRKVIDIQEGKDKETIADFVCRLEGRQGDRRQIEQVSIDMSTAFIAGTLEMLPNAQMTFDKFHLIQHLNQAMDEVRKGERRGNEMLKKHKYTFLYAREKLSAEKVNSLDTLLLAYPKLGEAYRLKEMFKDVFEIENPDEAKGYLQYWCDMVMESGIQPFIKFVQLVKAHWFGIVNYFESKLTNGILEGINSKIQLVKRRARGFRSIQSFFNMIYFTCGKLEMTYPHETL
jgi:transposase